MCTQQTSRQRKRSHVHSLTAKGGVSCFKDDPNGLFNLPSKEARNQCHIIAHSLDTSQSHTGCSSCNTAYKFLPPSSYSCLMKRVSGETEPHPWATGGLGWYSGFRRRLSSLGLLYTPLTISIDRDIYDVWLRGDNGVREHSGADWKGRGKRTMKHIYQGFFCSQKPAIALILGKWGMLHFSSTPPWF